jgi:hypothetical protein
MKKSGRCIADGENKLVRKNGPFQEHIVVFRGKVELNGGLFRATLKFELGNLERLHGLTDQKTKS